jgi:PEP-CTERM motif
VTFSNPLLKKDMNMKIKLKTLLASLVVATSFFASVSANAADINQSTAINLVGGPTDYSGSFGGAFTDAQFNQTFDHKWLFTLPTNSDLVSTLTSGVIGKLVLKTKDLSITSFNLLSDDNPDVLVYSALNTGINGNDSWEITYSGLSASPNPNYYLNVIGKVTGSKGGSYGAQIDLVSAVPEPETYAMMLAGLGLMGAVARRRKAKQA